MRLFPSQRTLTHRSPHEDSPGPDELRELVRRAQGGDREAFAALYDRYLTPLYRFIYLRVRRREDAEELAQLTFMKAWQALPRYREEGNPLSAWLYRIARNAVIDHWKKRRDLRIEDEEERMHGIPDASPLPQAEAEHRERTEVVREAIRHLTEDQQEIIILKFIEDRTNHEIASITGRSEDAIRQLQLRALRALRAILKDATV